MNNFFENKLTRSQRRERKRSVDRVRKHIERLGDKYHYLCESLSDDKVFELHSDFIRNIKTDTYRLHIIYNNLSLKHYQDEKLKYYLENFIERSDNKLKRTIKLKEILNGSQ